MDTEKFLDKYLLNLGSLGVSLWAWGWQLFQNFHWELLFLTLALYEEKHYKHPQETNVIKWNYCIIRAVKFHENARP